MPANCLRSRHGWCWAKFRLTIARLVGRLQALIAHQNLPPRRLAYPTAARTAERLHLTGTGVVMGPATRHGHCAASIADCRDILQMEQLLSALIQRLTRETVVQLTDFR